MAFVQARLTRASMPALAIQDRPAMVAGISPLRRVAEPEEMAEAALWLASGKASYANGAILGMTGGL